MPQATVNLDPEHFDLKSLPGGFVELRRMPYGTYLTRQQMALSLKVKANRNQQNVEGQMDMANKAVTVFEFQQCIVNHNLEDANGQPLDFRQAHNIDMLDPRVGDEIGTLINELHQFDAGNSVPASDSPSSEAGSSTLTNLQGSFST